MSKLMYVRSHCQVSVRHPSVCNQYRNNAYSFPQIRTNKYVRYSDLQDLFDGKIAALRIPNFIPNEAISHALTKLSSEYVIEDYNNAQGVGRLNLGMAYFEATESSTKKALYYQKAIPAIEAIRNGFFPYLAPMDAVRLILDEQWPHGCNLLNLQEGPMFLGLIRALTEEVLAHEDKLERDDPEAKIKLKLKPNQIWEQFAVNCYLQVPKEGGDLKLWNISLPDDKYNKLQRASKSEYGISPSLLPQPLIVIHPEKGDLIFFNSRNLHAVTPSKDEIRISTSGFIKYRGKDTEIDVWS